MIIWGRSEFSCYIFGRTKNNVDYYRLPIFFFFSFVFFFIPLPPSPDLRYKSWLCENSEWLRDFTYLDFSSFVSHASTVFLSNCFHTFFFFFSFFCLPPELAVFHNRLCSCSWRTEKSTLGSFIIKGTGNCEVCWCRRVPWGVCVGTVSA